MEVTGLAVIFLWSFESCVVNIHLVSLKCPSLFYWRLALIGMAWLKFRINSAIELGSCEFVWMKQREAWYFKIFQSQNACDQVEIRESLRCSPRLHSCFWFTLECMSVIVFMCGFGGLILTDYCFRKQALPNNLFWTILMNWKKIIAPKWAICNCYLAACREPNSYPSSLLSLALGTLHFHPVSTGLSIWDRYLSTFLVNFTYSFKNLKVGVANL